MYTPDTMSYQPRWLCDQATACSSIRVSSFLKRKTSHLPDVPSEPRFPLAVQSFDSPGAVSHFSGPNHHRSGNRREAFSFI